MGAALDYYRIDSIASEYIFQKNSSNNSTHQNTLKETLKNNLNEVSDNDEHRKITRQSAVSAINTLESSGFLEKISIGHPPDLASAQILLNTLLMLQDLQDLEDLKGQKNNLTGLRNSIFSVYVEPLLLSSKRHKLRPIAKLLSGFLVAQYLGVNESNDVQVLDLYANSKNMRLHWSLEKFTKHSHNVDISFLLKEQAFSSANKTNTILYIDLASVEGFKLNANKKNTPYGINIIVDNTNTRFNFCKKNALDEMDKKSKKTQGIVDMGQIKKKITLCQKRIFTANIKNKAILFDPLRKIEIFNYNISERETLDIYEIIKKADYINKHWP